MIRRSSIPLWDKKMLDAPVIWSTEWFKESRQGNNSMKKKGAYLRQLQSERPFILFKS